MNGDAEESVLTLADLRSDDSEENKWCAEAGGEVGGSGASTRDCVFPDGSECEEWAFFRGQCGPGGTAEGAGMPNPASVHCADQGGKLEIRAEAGGEVGYLLFEDGSECEEWAFYRGDCAPGESKP
jgi:putative hemolysin